MSEAVSCIIFNKERDQVLLIKRRDIPVWVLPGGGIEQGETSEQAAERETFEETGLKVKAIRHVAHYLPANRLTKVTDFFECLPLDGHPHTGSETRDIAYFPLNALPSRLVPFYKTWIADALINTPKPLEKTIQKTSYGTFVLYLMTHPILVFRFLLARMGIHINSN